MSEIQNNVEHFLKVQGKSKRDLAKALKIRENSINRTLKNPGIKLSKIDIIADFFGVSRIEILSNQNLIKEPDDEFQRLNPYDTTNQLTISNLADTVNRNSKIIENLVQIIAEKIPDKKE